MKKTPKNIPSPYKFAGTSIFRDTTALPFLDGGPLVDKTNHGKLLNSVYASALGNYYANGGMLKRADGSYSPRGLWDNIRDNAGSGKKPTKQMLAQEKKINNNYKNGGQFQGNYSLPEDSFKQGGNNLHNSVYASSPQQYPAVYNFGGTLKNNLATRQQMYMPLDHITRTGGSILSMSNTPQLEGEGKDLVYALGGNLSLDGEPPVINKTQDEVETFAYATPAAEKKHKQLMDKAKALMTTVKGREAWYQDVKPKDFTNKELSRFITGAEDYRKQAEEFERARRKVKEDKISTSDFSRMYEDRDWGRFDPYVMKEGAKGQYQNAVDEANARKTENYELVKNVAGELSNYNAARRIYDDPLGTLKGVGQTVADLALYGNPGIGSAFGAGDPNVNPLTGNQYWSGLDKTLDVAGFIPVAIGAGKGIKELLKQGNRLGIKNVVTGKAKIGDLFQRDDLVNFKTPEDLAAYERALAEENLNITDPTRNRFYSGLETNPDVFNYIKGSDQVFMHRIPQTKAAAAGKSLANIKSEGAALIAQQRSIPTSAAVEELIAAGKLVGYSEETINDLRKIAANPEGYWNLPIFKNNKELQSLVADPTIVNPAEHFLPRPAVGDFKLVGAGAIPLMANPKLIDIKPVVSAFESGYTNTNKAKLAVAPQTMSEEEAETLSRQDPNK